MWIEDEGEVMDGDHRLIVASEWGYEVGTVQDVEPQGADFEG
jgi:hypothetical protein